MSLRVVVAGASGFVGRALVARLSMGGSAAVRALTRDPETSPCERATWDGDDATHQARCDLFSLVQTEHALKGCDVGVYLVHSMRPRSRLIQARFPEIDLLLADNFARAARAAGLRRIVYLGGMLPASGERLSSHLASRAEVEHALAAHGVPVVSLRAGLVLGPGGSSTEMMVRLVERLPVMLCPSWTLNVSYPVALEDALDALAELVLEASEPVREREGASDAPIGQGAPSEPGTVTIHDCVGATSASYLELLRETARLLGVHRGFVPFPFVPPRVSGLWVSLVTGYDRGLVSPLVDSLRYELRPSHAPPPRSYGAKTSDWKFALADVLRRRTEGSLEASHVSTPPSGIPRHNETRARATRGPSLVVSIQRLPCPPGWSAGDVALDYAHWLPMFFRPLIRVRFDGTEVAFRFLGVATPLLVLALVQERSDARRTLFRIRGGLLARVREDSRGRLEFRTLRLGAREVVLAAVIDFEPALPWYLYRATQAVAHSFVMACYGVRLGRIGRTGAISS